VRSRARVAQAFFRTRETRLSQARGQPVIIAQLRADACRYNVLQKPFRHVHSKLMATARIAHGRRRSREVRRSSAAMQSDREAPVKCDTQCERMRV
jgi:hypothetical protein